MSDYDEAAAGKMTGVYFHMHPHTHTQIHETHIQNLKVGEVSSPKPETPCGTLHSLHDHQLFPR